MNNKLYEQLGPGEVDSPIYESLYRWICEYNNANQVTWARIIRELSLWAMCEPNCVVAIVNEPHRYVATITVGEHKLKIRVPYEESEFKVTWTIK